MDEDAAVDLIPLWKHRMSKITDILAEHNVESVLDLGCGEGKLLQCLRHNPKITALTGVDVDVPSLTKAIPALQPLLTDMLQPRLKPLTIKFFHGSVDTVDLQFTGYDAVIMIEVIEHLDPTVLYKCPCVVLGALRPKIFVVSTPNSEYNVHFGEDRKGILRHGDHRFEWTRKEFRKWCERVASKHGYRVAYDGLGDPKPEFPDVGSCTQIAVFERMARTAEEPADEHPEDNLPFPLIPEVYCSLWTRNPLKIEGPGLGEYTLFHKIDYPTFTGNLEDEIHHTLVYAFNMLSRNEHNEYDRSVVVTLDDLLQHSKIKRLCETKTKLISCLEESMVFSVSEDGTVKADLDLTMHEDQPSEGGGSEEENENSLANPSREQGLSSTADSSSWGDTPFPTPSTTELWE